MAESDITKAASPGAGVGPIGYLLTPVWSTPLVPWIAVGDRDDIPPDHLPPGCGGGGGWDLLRYDGRGVGLGRGCTPMGGTQSPSL